jgi:hypothetical protein
MGGERPPAGLTHIFTGLQEEEECLAVDKVGIGPIATANGVPKAPKLACLLPDLGRKRASREFFNTL